MKKLIFTTIICTISFSCLAQKTENIIRTTQAANGQRVDYITEATFKNISINGILKLQIVREPNSIEEVINILGQPLDVKHEKTRAVDGTIITETKILSYPGLTFIYPLHENFVVSKIELTSDTFFLCIDNLKLQVGMSIKKVADILPAPSRSKKNGVINIDVAETNSSQILKQARNGNINIGFKNLNIKYDPATGKLTKITISIRYI